MLDSIVTVDFVAGFVTCLACVGGFFAIVVCLCHRYTRRRTHPLKKGTVAAGTAPLKTVPVAIALERHASTLDMMLKDTWSVSESARWLNILGSRLFQHDATIGFLQSIIQEQIVDMINSYGKLPGLGYIRITDLNLGKAPPMIEDIDIRLVPVADGENGREESESPDPTYSPRRSSTSSTCETQITVGFAYNGGATVGVETEVVLDWPIMSIIGLPIAVNTTVSEMSGKVRIRCPPVDPSGETTFGISFTEPPVIRLALKTEFGEHLKLVNPPKLEEVINAYIEDTCTSIVTPREHIITLPGNADTDKAQHKRTVSNDSLGSVETLKTTAQKRR